MSLDKCIKTCAHPYGTPQSIFKVLVCTGHVPLPEGWAGSPSSSLAVITLQGTQRHPDKLVSTHMASPRVAADLLAVFLHRNLHEVYVPPLMTLGDMMAYAKLHLPRCYKL